MNDSYDVRRAAARLARLTAHGRTATPEELDEARATLVYEKLQRELRLAQRSSPPLDPAHVAHLVALLTGPGATQEDAVARLERIVVEAVNSTSGRLTAGDRERIAESIAKVGDQA